MITLTTGPGKGGAPAPPSNREVASARAHKALAVVGRRGGYFVLLVLVVACIIAKPHVFPTWTNITSILELSAVPAVLAMGVTPVLLGGEFDLAFTGIAGVAAAVLSVVMAHSGWAAIPAVVLTLVVAALGGAVDAVVVVHQRVESFIGTLAVGSVAGGVEIAVGKNTEIYSGISPKLLKFLDAKPLFGLTTPVWVAVGVAIVLTVLIRFSKIGHQLGAVGGNKEAAIFAGVRVNRRLALAFIISGLVAGIAAILLVGQADSYSPNSAASFLLSSYTAAFVGLAFNGRSRFSIGGTMLGVLLTEVLQNGLSITNQPTWVDSVLNGVVLLAAVRLTLGRRRG